MMFGEIKGSKDGSQVYSLGDLVLPLTEIEFCRGRENEERDAQR